MTVLTFLNRKDVPETDTCRRGHARRAAQTTTDRSEVKCATTSQNLPVCGTRRRKTEGRKSTKLGYIYSFRWTDHNKIIWKNLLHTQPDIGQNAMMGSNIHVIVKPVSFRALWAPKCLEGELAQPLPFHKRSQMRHHSCQDLTWSGPGALSWKSRCIAYGTIPTLNRVSLVARQFVTALSTSSGKLVIPISLL